MCEATLNRTRAADLRASARSEDGGGYTGREDAKTREIPSNFRRRGHRSATTRQVGCSRWKANSRKLARFAIERHASRDPACFLSAPAFILSRTILLPPSAPSPRHGRTAAAIRSSLTSATWLPQTSSDSTDRSTERRYAADCQSFIGARRARISRGVIASLASRDLPRERRLRRGIVERSQTDALINSIAPESCP